MTLLLALMAAVAAEGTENMSTITVSEAPFGVTLMSDGCELPVPDALQLLTDRECESDRGEFQQIRQIRRRKLEADSRTLFLTNFNSNSLQTIDLERLPLKPK
jgi:hypothetical protein